MILGKLRGSFNFIALLLLTEMLTLRYIQGEATFTNQLGALIQKIK